MKNVIIYSTSGEVSIMTPAPSWTGSLDEPAVKDIPDSAQYAIVDESALPDRYFREAWRFENGQAVIDIEAAKEVQREAWRSARGPVMAELDIYFMRAIERGDAEEQAEIVAQKTALRNITDTPLPNNPEGIKAVWPEILGARP